MQAWIWSPSSQARRNLINLIFHALSTLPSRFSETNYHRSTFWEHPKRDRWILTSPTLIDLWNVYRHIYKIQWLSTERAEGMVAIYYGVRSKKRGTSVDKKINKISCPLGHRRYKFPQKFWVILGVKNHPTRPYSSPYLSHSCRKTYPQMVAYFFCAAKPAWSIGTCCGLISRARVERHTSANLSRRSNSSAPGLVLRTPYTVVKLRLVALRCEKPTLCCFEIRPWTLSTGNTYSTFAISSVLACHKTDERSSLGGRHPSS